MRGAYIAVSVVLLLTAPTLAFGQASPENSYNEGRTAVGLYTQCRVGDVPDQSALPAILANAYCKSYVEAFLRAVSMTSPHCHSPSLYDALLLYRRYYDMQAAKGVNMYQVSADDALWQALFAPAGCGVPAK